MITAIFVTGAHRMNLDRAINLLATVTLVEMMLSIGMGTTWDEILRVAKDARQVTMALIANYLVVPAVAVALFYLVQPSPMVAVGILVGAVCPGAPYGPPFNAMAKGNVPRAVGFMVILAATSAILAPLLLMLLLPMLTRDQPVQLNVLKLVMTLVLSQFLPLIAGLVLRARRPALAEKLKNPAAKLCLVLNLVLLALILATNYKMLLGIRTVGYLSMLCLVLVAAASGWLLGGPGNVDRKTLSITTAVRNVGVSLVIVTSSFPGSTAIASATAFAIFQTILMAIAAIGWGRLSTSKPAVHATPAAG